jgi:hypothetical protein
LEKGDTGGFSWFTGGVLQLGNYVNINLKTWLSGRPDRIFSPVGSAFVFLMPYNSHVLAFWDVPAA